MKLHTIRLVYTNIGIFIEFWRWGVFHTTILNSLYRISEQRANNLIFKYNNAYGLPQCKVCLSGTIYISYKVK